MCGFPLLAKEENDTFALLYDVEKNRFIDEDGFVVHDIYQLITPNELLLFRHNGEYALVRHRYFKEICIELYFPDDGWDEMCYNSLN